MRPIFTVSILILPLAPVLASAQDAVEAGVVQISSDPYTNTDSQHATQVEPDIESSGSTLVATFQSGRFFDGGSSNIGWSTSQDGGVTWVDGFIPNLTINGDPPGPLGRASDPSVAYDAKHDHWIIAVLGLQGTTGVGVGTSVSMDGGLTFSKPHVVAYKPSGFYDKSWIGCDNFPESPFYGNCYVTWDDANLGDRVLMSTSTDGGITWGPKISPQGNPSGLGGQPLARPDGIVGVPASDGGSLFIFGSLNGGQSWTPTKPIASLITHGVAGGLRTTTYLPSTGVDGAGKLYVVWPDCRFRAGCSSNDIVMSTSTNGTTWTSPVRIPIDAPNSTVDHFIPGLGVDPTTSGANARLALTYYYYPNADCSFATCQLDVGFIASTDGGATWSASQQVAGPMLLSDIADTNQGRMVGDYISTSFAGPNAVPVFSLATAKMGQTFHQETYSAMFPVTELQAYTQPAVKDPILTFGGDPIVRTYPFLEP